ncbi:hypothetical protein DNTS_024865 [Danionella cerebrum]|uniref:Uncharacterized protein n=1 Tax=Danionella cerebrum TaxID=2873325 RepID=A0A553QS53_9TELE|nr:hypothetical protein DNTS_024865 [Danionella translucida]
MRTVTDNPQTSSEDCNVAIDDLKLQAFSMNLLTTSDLSKVTSCMQHALSVCHPRTRYSAGWDAKFLWIPLSYLPACAADILINALLPSVRPS